MARPSIAIRLSLGLALGTALLWTGAASISATVMRNQLNEAFDEALQQSAFRLLPLALHNIREPGEGEELQITGLDEAGDESFFTYYVRDNSGRLIVKGDNAPDALASATIVNGFSEVDGQRLFAITDHRSGYGIVVIERFDHRSTALSASVAALAWPLLGLIPLIALGIWVAIRLAMRPVERLRRDIESRDGRNLTPVSFERHPVELAPIAEAIASLIERLKAAMDAERAFAASSAHELRTPIAGALAQTQQLALELGNAPGAGRLRQIESALKNLAQLAEKLLQMSRLESGFARSDSVADLMPVLDLVVRDFRSRTEIGGRLTLAKSSGATLLASIHSDAFAMAITNLIQNALLHGDPASPISLSLRFGNVISVASGGPVVAADILERIGQPFQRGSSRVSGSGLGLAIVRAIMDQTGGSMAIHSPATGREDGFEVILKLPNTPSSVLANPADAQNQARKIR